MRHVPHDGDSSDGFPTAGRREERRGAERDKIHAQGLVNEKKPLVFTSPDTGPGVSELAELSELRPDGSNPVLWPMAKAGRTAAIPSAGIIPLSARARPLIEGLRALHEALVLGQQ